MRSDPQGKVVVVVGGVLAIQNELIALGRQHTIQYIPYSTRDQLIYDFQKIAEEFVVDVVLFMNGSHGVAPINGEVLSPLLPSLSLVAGIGAGFDHLDVDWMAAHGVYYANTPYAVGHPTATTATMLLLQAIRAASEAELTVRRGEWRGLLCPTPDTRGMVLGILGMGHIGRLVQKQVEAFGMKVIYHNRRRLSPSEEQGATYVSFEELLSRSDAISIHTPLTPQTRHSISDAQFAQMRDGVFIVNTSRGAVIDENALVRAMQCGKVARVGLDVFENEPEVHPYLLKSERASLLPHWGAITSRVLVEGEQEAFRNVTAWMQTGVPKTPANRPQRK